MFRPASIFIGLRYTRAKKRNYFISFISLTSMLGIALGVTVLITVLSVMNGFDEEIKNRIFELAPQITIQNVSGTISNWNALLNKVKKISGILQAAPFVNGQGMLVHDDIVQGIMITGINPTDEVRVSEIESKMVAGKLSTLRPGQFGIVLGQELAEGMGVRVGDKVTLVTPETSISPVGVVPVYKRFTIVGIFHAGSGFGFDSQLAFINLRDAQILYQLGQAVTGIRLKINDLYQAPAKSQELIDKLTSDYYVTNWTQRYGPLFKAIKLEKNMMFLILLLIIAVATFNLVSSLVMIVNEKQPDIAILRTLGATPKNIMSIFIIQGFIVGLVGTILGVIGGITLAANVTPIVNMIEKIFRIQFLSSNIYYINYLPSKLDFHDIFLICLAAFIFSLLATLYPAWRASKTEPAEALRYE